MENQEDYSTRRCIDKEKTHQPIEIRRHHHQKFMALEGEMRNSMKLCKIAMARSLASDGYLFSSGQGRKTRIVSKLPISPLHTAEPCNLSIAIRFLLISSSGIISQRIVVAVLTN